MRLHITIELGREASARLDRFESNLNLIMEGMINMDQNIADLTKSFEDYKAVVDKLIAQSKTDIDKAVAEAIAKDDADEAVDLQALKKQIDDAHAKLVPPPFDPSANG